MKNPDSSLKRNNNKFYDTDFDMKSTATNRK